MSLSENKCFFILANGKKGQKNLNEIATTKPKPIKAKRKTDKMKFIYEQLRAANENT